MVAPDEREFQTFARGHIRDNVILAAFRESLRGLTNPETGLVFTEDEIERSTQPGSRFYIEADAIDIMGQAYDARALFFADQIDPERASDDFLDLQHGRFWFGLDSRLDAVGASGNVLGVGDVGTLYVGSQTIGDPTAVVGTDPNGLRYQVLADTTLVLNPETQRGEAIIPVKGIDTGFETNLPSDTVITWSQNVPLGSQPTAAVVVPPGTQAPTGLQGGLDGENSADYAARILRRIRRRPASGNNAHFEAWAEQSSVAVEKGFVYATALHAGSVLVAFTEKRDPNALGGPLARIATAGTLVDVTNFLVPPASPVVPQRVFVLVTPTTAQPTDLVMRIAMGLGIGAGWFDAVPFPNPPVPPDLSTTSEAQISAVTSQTDFDMTVTGGLPGGAAALSAPDAPAMMVWNDATSRFERLGVATITDLGGGSFNVVLNTAPTKTLVVEDRLSPYTDRLDIIAEAIEEFFDTLGPGEVVDANDLRASRAARFPEPEVEFPTRAGQAVVSVVVDSLTGVASDAELTRISRSEPDLPANISDGPNMITLGRFNLYPL